MGIEAIKITFLFLRFIMNLYTITFVDGTRVRVNAETSEEAIRNAQTQERKAVASVSHERSIKEEPAGAFEGLQHGGPNF